MQINISEIPPENEKIKNSLAEIKEKKERLEKKIMLYYYSGLCGLSVIIIVALIFIYLWDRDIVDSGYLLLGLIPLVIFGILFVIFILLSDKYNQELHDVCKKETDLSFANIPTLETLNKEIVSLNSIDAIVPNEIKVYLENVYGQGRNLLCCEVDMLCHLIRRVKESHRYKMVIKNVVENLND
ncbi:MAG: hypothetical protein RBR08_14475 [Desulforegulaceae bacterium]|nr:hypothetical protein [Desulforegulaceae bacterium]